MHRFEHTKIISFKAPGKVNQMILTEYNEELHARTLVEEGRREDRAKDSRYLSCGRRKARKHRRKGGATWIL